MVSYRIVNTITNKILIGINWEQGKNKTPGRHTVRWSNFDDVDDPATLTDIAGINWLIKSVISRKLRANLDNCEIRAYRREYTPVRTSVKIEKTRNRIEQEVMIAVLKK